MAIPTGVTIVRITEGVNFDPGGRALRTKIISYTVGNDGPFTLEVTPDLDTTDYIESRLAEAAAKIAALRGAQP